MLDLMRKHAGTWLIKVILGAIIVVFSFWGIGSYRMNKVSRVAVVNGTTVTIDQYREAYNGILNQLRQRFGNNLNDEMIKMFDVKKQALDRVVNQALLLEEARRLDLSVTDQELTSAIRDMAVFQSNTGFDARLYRRVLNMNRMTPETFESMQRESLLVEKLRRFVNQSVKVSDAEVREWYDWSNASVNIRYALFEPGSYKDIEPGKKDLEAYFDENKAAYKTEPLIKARYVQMKPEAFKNQVSISEDQVREYYDDHPQEYEKAKTVQARHILFKVGNDEPPEKADAVRTSALDILEKIRNGADFAETARKYSEGPSKDDGGYLGTFKKEDMVSPFADKAFSMEEGEVSDPVRTQFGWHIIKVEKVNPAATVTLKEAESAIRTKLADERARVLAYDDAEAVYEATFEENDLSKIAAERHFELYTTSLFGKDGPKDGIENGAQFAVEAFKLKDDEISEVKEIGDRYFIIQVVERVPEKIPDLSAVEDRVKEDLVKKLQGEKAKEDAKRLLEMAHNGKTLTEASKAFDIKVSETGWFKRTDAVSDIGYEPAIAESAFNLSNEKALPEDVIKGNKGFYVILFKGRKLPDIEGYGTEKAAIKQRLMNQKELAAFNALLDNIRQRSEIEISEGYRD